MIYKNSQFVDFITQVPSLSMPLHTTQGHSTEKPNLSLTWGLKSGFRLIWKCALQLYSLENHSLLSIILHFTLSATDLTKQQKVALHTHFVFSNDCYCLHGIQCLTWTLGSSLSLKLQYIMFGTKTNAPLLSTPLRFL